MSSKPIFYSWDDEGSPGRNLTGNLQDRLKQILKSCLVNGYGDKPGAGWSIGHEHPNGFSLVSGRGDFVINFVSNLSGMSSTTHVYAANSITDSTEAIIKGANLCSAEYPSKSNVRHNLGKLDNILWGQLSSLQWVVFSDENTFILNMSTNSSASNPNGYSITIYGGEVVNYTGINTPLVLGGDRSSYGSYGNMYAYTDGYSCPRNPITGLNDQGAVIVGSQPYSSFQDTDPTKTIEVKEVELLKLLKLQQPRAASHFVTAGELRGVLYDDVLRFRYTWSMYLTALGIQPDYDNRCKPVIIDGHTYVFARSYSGNSILTDNPAFW